MWVVMFQMGKDTFFIRLHGAATSHAIGQLPVVCVYVQVCTCTHTDTHTQYASAGASRWHPA
jgi:hypothetical protein